MPRGGGDGSKACAAEMPTSIPPRHGHHNIVSPFFLEKGQQKTAGTALTTIMMSYLWGTTAAKENQIYQLLQKGSLARPLTPRSCTGRCASCRKDASTLFSCTTEREHDTSANEGTTHLSRSTAVRIDAWMRGLGNLLIGTDELNGTLNLLCATYGRHETSLEATPLHFRNITTPHLHSGPGGARGEGMSTNVKGPGRLGKLKCRGSPNGSKYPMGQSHRMGGWVKRSEHSTWNWRRAS